MKDIPSLYHYSEASGLIGVVNSKCLWMSNIHYQDDAEEYYHALGLIKNILDTQYPELHLPDFIASRAKILDVFTFSLTEESDLLSQWRGYCPSEGFSFRFNRNQFLEVLKSPNLMLNKVRYTEEEKIDFIKNIIIGFSPEDFKNRDNLKYPHPATNFSINADYSISKSAKFLVRKIFDYAPFLKDQRFEKEKEWRIVTVRPYPAITLGVNEIESTPLPYEIKFRDRGSLIIPYIEIPLTYHDKKVLIDEVVIGPSQHQELSAFSIKAMLGNNIKVTSSSTSYRYWRYELKHNFNFNPG